MLESILGSSYFGKLPISTSAPIRIKDPNYDPD